MSKLFLITGFLGAGKTTFLRHFLNFFQGEKIRMIVNEFGAVGIDGDLLAGLGGHLQEISGGSVFCACRLDQFEKALLQCGQDETILVEASGLSDPTGVRRLFSQTERFPHIQYMGSVCLVDALRFPKVYATSRTCVRQLAASDVVVLNKVDRATAEQLNHTRELIRGQRPDIPVIETSYGSISEDFLQVLTSAQGGDRQPMPLVADLSNKKITIHISPDITAYDLEMLIRMFAEESYRIKGFLMTKDAGLVLADCVGNVVSVTPTQVQPPSDKVGYLTILAGGKTPIYTAVNKACEWYQPYILVP